MTGPFERKRGDRTPMRREWYVYVPAYSLVLSGYATEAEARQEAERVGGHIPERIEVLPRSHKLIIGYARTHPAWAKREGLASTSSGGQEAREGDVGTLTKDLLADDMTGETHTIPAGVEVIVQNVYPEFISFWTREIFEDHNLFTAPPLEFRGAFRKRGAASQISGQVEVYPEVREGDVGTLVESLMADDTAGYSHRIPVGMEIKVARVEPKFIGFHTGDVIEGENYFITPLTLEFRRKFRKRSEGERVDEVAIRILELLKEKGPMTEYEISTELGVPPERVGETTDILMGESKIERELPTGVYKLPSPTRHVCPVCGDPVAGGSDEYLGHIKTKHPEEWRRLETDPGYTLRRAEAGPRQLVPIVRQLPTVTIRGKKVLS